MPQLVRIRIRIRLHWQSTPLSIVFHGCLGSDRSETLTRKVLSTLLPPPYFQTTRAMTSPKLVVSVIYRDTTAPTLPSMGNASTRMSPAPIWLYASISPRGRCTEGQDQPSGAHQHSCRGSELLQYAPRTRYQPSSCDLSSAPAG